MKKNEYPKYAKKNVKNTNIKNRQIQKKNMIDDKKKA